MRNNATYLGAALNNRGVQHGDLVSRMHRANKCLRVLRRATLGWFFSPRQEAQLLQTLVYSIIHYVTFLKPLSAAVRLPDVSIAVQRCQSGAWMLVSPKRKKHAACR